MPQVVRDIDMNTILLQNAFTLGLALIGMGFFAISTADDSYNSFVLGAGMVLFGFLVIALSIVRVLSALGD